MRGQQGQPWDARGHHEGQGVSLEGRAGAATGCKGWPCELGAAPIQCGPPWGADKGQP